MKQFMWTYINPNSGLTGRWMAASLKTADNLQKGPPWHETCENGPKLLSRIVRICPLIHMGSGANQLFRNRTRNPCSPLKCWEICEGYGSGGFHEHSRDEGKV